MFNNATSEQTSCYCSVTASKIADMLKEAWQQFKQTDADVAGNYYYDMFLNGILFNKTIEIKIIHFNSHLQYHLDQIQKSEIKQVIYRAIFETVQSIKGFGFAYAAKTEDRIRWRFS